MTKRFACAILGVMASGCGPGSAVAAMPETSEGRAAVAVADFDYADTSGEVQDQRVGHRHRMATFDADIVAGLSKDPRFAARRLSCGQSDCSIEALGPDQLLTAARTASARYVVYGGVHKSSTLVQWMKVEMIDLISKNVVASTLFTFRGDTDEAFRHAARFAVGEVCDAVK